MRASAAKVRRQSGRDRLLATARRLFTSRGAANVGINEVTDAAGVARMTLYNNFPSKEALALAVYEEMADSTLSELRQLEAIGQTETQRIVAVFDHFAAKADEPDYRGCPFIQASLQAPDSAGKIYSIVSAYKQALRSHVFHLLDEVRTERAELADQLVLLLDGAVTEAYLKGVAQPSGSAKRAAATLLRGTQ